MNCRNVIWLADTNYRIDLDNATVRALAERDDFDPLLAADQVWGVLKCSWLRMLISRRFRHLASSSHRLQNRLRRI